MVSVLNSILTKSEMAELLMDTLAIFEVDMDSGIITLASRELERMFGYTLPGELEGKVVEVLVPEALRDIHANVHRPGFAANPEPRMMGRRGSRPTVMILSGQRQDGTVFPVEIALRPRASRGQRVVLGIVSDMTGRA